VNDSTIQRFQTERIACRHPDALHSFVLIKLDFQKMLTDISALPQLCQICFAEISFRR
jgi:hypothetical protein